MAQIRKKKPQSDTLPFGKQNLYLLAIGLLTLLIGYIFMAQPPVYGFWSLTLAPIVLLIAYIFIIPFSIFYRKKKG